MSKYTLTIESENLEEIKAHTTVYEMEIMIEAAHAKLRSILKHMDVPENLYPHIEEAKRMLSIGG